MKLFASWSGGKDCMLALHKVLKSDKYEVTALVNMCDADGQHSRSHGLKKELIRNQAEQLGIDIIQEETDIKGYEQAFKSVIASLKEQGVEGGVFGDIYLMEHRVWIERVCSEMGIIPVFPLWEVNTLDLINEFVDLGFKTLTVSVNKNKLDKTWLNRLIDQQFIEEISKLEGIDACAENGEYHSFVFDGPIFKSAVSFDRESVVEDDKYWFQQIELKN